MKKLFSLLVVLIAMCTSAWAEAGTPELAFTGDVLSGGTGQIEVTLATNGALARDFEFWIELPAGIEFDGAACIHMSDIQPEFMSASSSGDNTKRHFIGVGVPPQGGGISVEDLYAKEGLLCTIDIKASAETTPGTTITGLACGSKEGGSAATTIVISMQGGDVAQADTDIPINVWGAILDEENEDIDNIIAMTGETSGILVKRTIKAGTWNSICLPFAMDEQQVTKAFGNDVEIADFRGIKYKDGDKDLTVKFSRVTSSSFEANHPYIFKPGSKISEDIKSFTVMETVSIVPEEVPLISYDEDYFIGNYAVEILQGPKTTNKYDTHFYLSDNNFYYILKGKSVTMKAFRGYIESDKIADYLKTHPASANVNFFVDDDAIDGIDGVTTSKVVEGVYDLQGRKVNDEHLKRGVYIIDGKKVVVK